MSTTQPTAQSWRSLLDAWSVEALDLIRSRAHQSASEIDFLKRGTLGFPPASEHEIADAECRLGWGLPFDYRGFLSVTNGLFHPGVDGVFLRASQIGMFSEVHPEQANTLLSVSNQIDCDPKLTQSHRAVGGILARELLLHSVAVSEVASGQFFGLLQPKAKSGHATAFAFDFWDAPRLYLSFFDLLQDERERSLMALGSSLVQR